MARGVEVLLLFEDAPGGEILGLRSYGEFYARLNAVMAGSATIHYAIPGCG
jgi:hypothetical protein